MIGSLVIAAALQSASPRIVEVADPSSSYVALEAVVNLPKMGPRDELAMMAIADCMLAGTEDYSAAQLRRWGSQTGRPPLVEFMPGYLRVSIAIPAGQTSTAVSMLDSLLRRAQFTNGALSEWTARRGADRQDFWQVALWPSMPKATDLRRTDIPDTYRRVMQPSAVTIGIGGAYTASDLAKLKERMSDWKQARAPRPTFDGGRVDPVLSNKSRVNTIEVRSQPIRAGDVGFSTQLLACFALAVGKGSTFFQVVRERSQFSYRLEGILWPVDEGWRLRMISARVESGYDAAKSDHWRREMIRAVAQWTDEQRLRALGVARASLKLRIGPMPLYLSGIRPIGSSIEDRTLFEAYWMAKTGQRWEPDKLLASMERVDIATLKAEAQKILETSTTATILGLGR